MQCVRLSGRFINNSLLGEKTVVQRKLFTLGGSEKGTGVSYNAAGDRKQDEKLLLPLTHIQQVPGKQIRPKLTRAFNYWLKVPENKVLLVGDVCQIFHNSSLLVDDILDSSVLRRGFPAAHVIYGVPSTINAANYALLIALKKSKIFNHPDAMPLCAEKIMDLYWGQGMETYWRDNYICPSVEEYQEMIKKKTSGLLMLPVQLMQLISENKSDFSKLTDILGQYFQIRDDYCNLCLQEYSKTKGYCEDITEGKFSFPVIHAIKSHPDDNQVINILRQRTRDIEVKKYCVTLLERFGSLSYTRRTLEELDAEIKAEVSKLGGNPQLEALLEEDLNLEEAGK